MSVEDALVEPFRLDSLSPPVDHPYNIGILSRSCGRDGEVEAEGEQAILNYEV